MKYMFFAYTYTAIIYSRFESKICTPIEDEIKLPKQHFK